MNQHLNKKTSEQMVEAVFALDLDPIKFKLMDKKEGQGWSRAKVDAVEREYRRFLALTAKYPDQVIAPDTDVDKFWHGHILDTMKYAEDCQNVFGYFLHHFPYFGMRDEEDAANLMSAADNTRKLYEKEFGAADAQAGAYRAATAAYCAATAEKKDAAYCAATAAPEAAYCARVAGQAESAYCAVAAKQDAAYCAATTKTAADAAYCAASAEPKAAYCAATVKAEASYCAAAKPEAAYCAASAKADAAYCAATAKTDAAYCAVSAGKEEAAYCAVSAASYCAAVVTAKGRPKLEPAEAA